MTDADQSRCPDREPMLLRPKKAVYGGDVEGVSLSGKPECECGGVGTMEEMKQTRKRIRLALGALRSELDRVERDLLGFAREPGGGE